jgi:hypothetical protein
MLVAVVRLRGRKRKGSVFRFAPRKRTYLPILELLPPPASWQRGHRGLARRRVAVRRRAILMVAKGERPQPRRAFG